MLKREEIFAELACVCDFSMTLDTDGLKVLDSRVKEAFALVKSFHNSGAGGVVVCKANSYVVDRLLACIYASFLKRRDKRFAIAAENFCVLALGGYGREEMAPNSDVDIVLLFSARLSKQIKASIADAFLYPLWNLGVKIGHVSLTSREAIENASKDPIFKTALLDVRFLFGSKALYSRFLSRLTIAFYLNKRSHFEQLMRLKRDRHEKSGWTPYLQEPNIKNGIGGLRDFQTMRWKTKLNLGGGIRTLAEHKLISTKEYSRVMHSFDFLLRVRNQLHYISTFPTDVVDIEYQPKLADFFCPEVPAARRVESFMRKLYFAFRNVDFVSKSARKRMRLRLPEDVKSNMRNIGTRVAGNKKIRFGEFSMWRGEISADSSSVFVKSPKSLIEVFLICQKFSVAPSETLELLIRDSLSLIDDKFRASPEISAIFLEIIQNRGKVFSALEVMHYWGVLGAYLPEFGEITCMVQQEYYHRFTADIHTLNSIANLDKIFCAGAEDGIYWHYHKVIMSLASPSLIYIMLLFHDIGKGDEIKGHSQHSAEIAEKILVKWGVPRSDIESILFAIVNHLEMSRFWQRNDVEDANAIRRFAKIVGNETNLKNLYILTFCDANATNETFWNSYKQGLHEMLYANTLQYFSESEAYSDASIERHIDVVVSEIISSGEIVGLEPLLFEHVNNLPPAYFLSHGKTDVVRQIHLVSEFKKKLSKGIDTPSVDWEDHPRRSVSSLCVVSKDRQGLFLTLVGVLTLLGFDILGTKIITRSDGITIDTFYVSGSGGVLKNAHLLDMFKEYFAKSLSGKISLDAEIEKIFARSSKKAKGDLISSARVYRRGGHIVLEVLAFDCKGILYQIAKRIRERGYDIVFARVNTEHRLGRNVFYIKKSIP